MRLSRGGERTEIPIVMVNLRLVALKLIHLTNVLRATKFEVIDNRGRPRGYRSAESDERSFLCLLDDERRCRVEMTSGTGGTALL